MGFNIDLEGRIDKIRLGAANSLQALFEAVANAAEAVDADGRVTIRVLRDTATPVMRTRTERIGRPTLTGFEVQDNGVIVHRAGLVKPRWAVFGQIHNVLVFAQAFQ